MRRRSYHTFAGFNIGLKNPSRWISIPHEGQCPYCAEMCEGIGAVTILSESHAFKLWLCLTEPCCKMHESKRDERGHLYVRLDNAKREGQS